MLLDTLWVILQTRSFQAITCTDIDNKNQQ